MATQESENIRQTKLKDIIWNIPKDFYLSIGIGLLFLITVAPFFNTIPYRISDFQVLQRLGLEHIIYYANITYVLSFFLFFVITVWIERSIFFPLVATKELHIPKRIIVLRLYFDLFLEITIAIVLSQPLFNIALGYSLDSTFSYLSAAGGLVTFFMVKCLMGVILGNVAAKIVLVSGLIIIAKHQTFHIRYLITEEKNTGKNKILHIFMK